MSQVCEECDNTGYVQIVCGNCCGSGEGRYDGSTCHQCHGSGVTYQFCSSCKEGQKQRKELWR